VRVKNALCLVIDIGEDAVGTQTMNQGEELVRVLGCDDCCLSEKLLSERIAGIGVPIEGRKR